MLVILVGGDWNMNGLWHYDFPFSWEWNNIIPTDFHSIIFQDARARNHQPFVVVLDTKPGDLYSDIPSGYLT